MMTDEKFVGLLKEAGLDENKLNQLLKAEGINLDEMSDEELDQVDGGGWLVPPSAWRLFCHSWGPLASRMYGGTTEWEKHRQQAIADRKLHDAFEKMKQKK